MTVLPYIVTAASIVGTVANSLQKRWCFYVWICTNTFWCVFNVINGSYAQALLYAFNFAMAILGLVKWKQNQRERKRVEKVASRFVENVMPDAPQWQKQYIANWIKRNKNRRE